MKSRIGEAVDAAPALILTYKYRLNPEKRQHRALERILEQQRQLYNAALQERIEAYQKAGKTITEVDQSRSLTVIRADDPAFAGVQRRIQRETLRRLDRAYEAFFKRAKQGAGASSGFPKFKSFHTFDGFGFDAFQQIKFDGKALRFAGMPGALRVFVDRALPSHQIKNIWFKREGRRWFCGLQVEAPLQDHRRGCGQREVGADWGTSVLAALSTGEMIANPRPHEAALAALRRAQRKVARRKKGSHRRRKALEELSRLTGQVANQGGNITGQTFAQHGTQDGQGGGIGKARIERRHFRRGKAGGGVEVVATPDGLEQALAPLMAAASDQYAIAPTDPEDMSFVHFTSGTTGKPKGVLHTTGGYLVYATLTFKYIFDYHEEDIYWCTADVGWVTGMGWANCTPSS